MPETATHAPDPTAQGADPSLGLFLIGLWSVAMLLLTWDIAAAPSRNGLGEVHTVMQAILLLAALGAGPTGAALCIGRRSRPA